jgi:hypothetical protein
VRVRAEVGQAAGVGRARARDAALALGNVARDVVVHDGVAAGVVLDEHRVEARRVALQLRLAPCDLLLAPLERELARRKALARGARALQGRALLRCSSTTNKS